MNFFFTLSKTLISLLIIISFTACSQYQTGRITVRQAPEPISCQKAVAVELADVDDDDLANILDQSFDNEGKVCWEQLVSLAIEQDRDLNKRHLRRAVKSYNNHGQRDLFKKSVLRYLKKLADTGEYRMEDRRLLESFSHMAINSASNNKDVTLVETRSVCRRLDPKLYTKIFNRRK